MIPWDVNYCKKTLYEFLMIVWVGFEGGKYGVVDDGVVGSNVWVKIRKRMMRNRE